MVYFDVHMSICGEVNWFFFSNNEGVDSASPGDLMTSQPLGWYWK
jgi:hypothetical protein